MWWDKDGLWAMDNVSFKNEIDNCLTIIQNALIHFALTAIWIYAHDFWWSDAFFSRRCLCLIGGLHSIYQARTSIDNSAVCPKRRTGTPSIMEQINGVHNPEWKCMYWREASRRGLIRHGGDVIPVEQMKRVIILVIYWSPWHGCAPSLTPILI